MSGPFPASSTCPSSSEKQQETVQGAFASNCSRLKSSMQRTWREGRREGRREKDATRGGEELYPFAAAQRRQQLLAAAVVTVNEGRRKSFRGRASGTAVALCGHAPHLSIRHHPLDDHGHPRPRQPAIAPVNNSVGLFCFTETRPAPVQTRCLEGGGGWKLKRGGRRELNGLRRGRASLGRGTICCIFR